jgi:60 kDa SS-A/Ro ribonucleoprotein
LAEPILAGAAGLIRAYRLPCEVVPSPLLTRRDVWEALLEDMPYMALIRNLATMTRVGLLAPLSAATRRVTERLRDGEGLRRSRVHPLHILMALKTYSTGRGMRGTHTWTPVPEITEALDAAFYQAYAAVEPAGCKLLVALDVSGSMGPWAGAPWAASRASRRARPGPATAPARVLALDGCMHRARQ